MVVDNMIKNGLLMRNNGAQQAGQNDMFKSVDEEKQSQ